MGNLLSDLGQRCNVLKLSPDDLHARRAAIEQAMQIEEAALIQTGQLLKTATPWAQWPEELRRALRAALTGAGDGVEAHKAYCLRRHLFRHVSPGLPPLPSSALSPLERRVAERLRADLPGQTPLGCGKSINALIS